MLDVFVGIGFTCFMIVFILVRALRLNRSEPWFVAFTPADKAKSKSKTPWRRTE